MITNQLEESITILTLADIAEEFDAVQNEEQVFSNALKHIGSNSANEAYFAGILADDVNEHDFIPEGEHTVISGSELYGFIGVNDTYVTLGKLKGVTAFKVNDGTDEFVYVGPEGKKLFS